MKNFLLSSFLIVASVSGVTASAAEESAVNSAQNANLVIFRADERAATSGISYWLEVDGERVGKLKRNGVINLQLSPGEHTIQSSDRDRSELVVNVQSGATTYVSASIDQQRQLDMTETAATEDLLAKASGNTQVRLVQ